MRDLLIDGLDAYLERHASATPVDPVLVEMEERAQRDGFPAIGRQVGRVLEIATRAIGARRVIELGSGFGYSAAWFARAVGEGGKVVCTDQSQELADAGMDFMRRLGLAERVRYRIGEASESLAEEEGSFDVILLDADKRRYPEHWRNASQRIRIGGLYICDNVLWSGRVAEAGSTDEDTAAIREHNQLVAADARFLSTILPLRDGVLLALRVR